jgi:S-disulfanyl-L-cysteine oxidoreductase SoxD
MGSPRLALILLLLASPALAQTYGVGRAPSAEELAASSITISPEGAGLPAGRGTAAEGAKLFVDKGCSGCHGEGAVGGLTAAPNLLAKKGPEFNAWDRGALLPIGIPGNGALPVMAPYATITWDFIRRGMPLGNEGTLTPDEVYSLTAYLLAINKIIPEDQVLDQDNLAKVKMPIGNDWAKVPGASRGWKPDSPRLPGYPY